MLILLILHMYLVVGYVTYNPDVNWIKETMLIHFLTTPLGAYFGKGYLVFVARVQPRYNTILATTMSA